MRQSHADVQDNYSEQERRRQYLDSLSAYHRALEADDEEKISELADNIRQHFTSDFIHFFADGELIETAKISELSDKELVHYKSEKSDSDILQDKYLVWSDVDVSKMYEAHEEYTYKPVSQYIVSAKI